MAWFWCQGCPFHWKLGEIEHIWGWLEVYGLGFIWQVRISFLRVKFLPEIFLWGVFTTIAPLTTTNMWICIWLTCKVCMGNAILTAKPADFDTHRCTIVFLRSRWHQYKLIKPYVWSSIGQSLFMAWFGCQGCRFHWKLGLTWGLWPGIYLTS